MGQGVTTVTVRVPSQKSLISNEMQLITRFSRTTGFSIFYCYVIPSLNKVIVITIIIIVIIIIIINCIIIIVITNCRGCGHISIRKLA